MALVAALVLANSAQAAPGIWSRTAPELVDFPRDIDASPTDPNTVYVALGDGGIARSTNGGSTWSHLGVDNGLDLGKGVANNLEVDPNSPQTLYVAGDQRVMRSLDGGETFNPVGAPGAPGRSDVLDTRAGAGPADTTVIAGGVLGRVFLSTDSGTTWSDKTGNLLFGSPGQVPGFIHVNAIELHPTDPDVAFASSGGVLARTLNLTSTTPTWTAIQAAPLAGSISDLEAVSGDADRLVVSTFTNGVFRSENAGDSATATPTFFTTSGLTGGVVSVAAIGSGGDGFLAASSDGVFKTNDIDSGWSELGGGLTGGDSAAVEVAPSDSGVYYMHSGKLIFRSGNGGISSTARPGIVASQVSHLASAGGRVWAGSADQLLVTDDGEDWSAVPAADPFPTGIVAAAPSAPDTILIAGPGEIRRSINAGASFGAASPTSPSSVVDLAFDPGNANRVYAAAFFNEVSVSGDGGVSWEQSDAGFPGPGADFDAEEIEVAAPVGSGPGVVFVGSTNTEPPIFASSDAGASWTPASTGLPANGQIGDLTADPSNPNVVYAVVDGPGLDPELYKTVNGGGTWSLLPAAEDSVPDSSFSIREVGVSPRDGRIVISADDVGTLDPPVVTVSTDGGTTFNPISPAIQHNFGSPQDIIFDDQTKALHIATNSSGLLDLGFRSDVSAALTGPDTATVGDELALTATVTAGGPDPVTGLGFELSLPAGVTPLSATPSAGTCALAQTIDCQLGAPATSAPVTIELAVRATAAGNQALTASATGNQADTNQANNQAGLTIAVADGPGEDPIDGQLSLKVSPGKDADPPFKFNAKGTLSGAGLSAEDCDGKVKLNVKKRKKKVLSRSAGLRFKNGKCSYKKSLKFEEAPGRKLKVQAGFAGSDAITAATSKTAKITLG